MGTWYNNDGLLVVLGVTEGTAGKAGEYRSNGPQRPVEMTVTLIDATATAAIYDNNVQLPAGARIEKVEVVTITAGTGTGAVLNVGLKRTDRSTELDYDGLVAAIPLTSMDAAGETTVLTAGSTYGGALLGTTLAYNGLLTVDYDTAAFTAGKVAIRIYWSNPTT